MQCKKALWSFLVVTLLIITGCSGVKSDSQTIVKHDIQKGGQLIYGSIQEPNTLNPLISNLLATAEVSSLIYSGLLITNDKAEWQPDLAVEVPTSQNGGVSPDGLTITYKLRHDVKWHDGVPFTADDVKFTWQTIMNRKVNVLSREGYDKISSIDTPDSYTIVIKFKEYYASYLDLFPIILPKHALESIGDINQAPFNRSPVGTGPFKFKEWKLADFILLEANPEYFRGKPNLDSIMYKIVPDANIMLTQLKAGALHMVNNIAFSQLEQVKSITGIRTVISPNMIWEHLDFNLDNVLFQDVKVRQAIALGIDRPSIITTTLKNTAAPALGDQSPLSWAYNTALTQSPRDVTMARDLLTQSGWKLGKDNIFMKEGRKLSFSISVAMGSKVRDLVAQTIAQQLKEVGIEVIIQPIDTNVFFTDTLKNRRFETAIYAWTAGVDPDNVSLWNSRKIPTRNNGYDGQNYSGWRNKEVDTLTEQGARALNVEARKQIYFRIQEIIASEYPIIPLYFRANIDAVKITVVNYQPNPTPAGNFWNAWQWGLTVSPNK